MIWWPRRCMPLTSRMCAPFLSPAAWPQTVNCGRRFEREAGQAGIAVYFPSRKLSTDNAAMIAAAAYPKFLAGDFADAEFSAEASLALV